MDERARYFRKLRKLRRSARRWSVFAGTFAGATAVLVPYGGLGWPDAVWAALSGGTVALTFWRWHDLRELAAQPAPERPIDPDAYVGVKGARDLPARGLAVLRELWNLREQLARAADRPPFKVFGEDTLLRVAQTLPRDAATLATIPGVTPRVLGRWGPALLGAVERGLALDDAELPTLPRHPRPVISGAMSRRIEKLRRWQDKFGARFSPAPLLQDLAKSGGRFHKG